MSNTFGKLFRLTSFGESHGPAMGGVIDGCPAGIRIDLKDIETMLGRRRPAQSDITSARKEKDEVRFLSGIHNGMTTGTPIGFYIENTDARRADYEALSDVFRPGHADYTYHVKYGGFNDTSGGGRSSARETVCRVVAGAIARQVLGSLLPALTIEAQIKTVGISTADNLESVVREVKSQGDTVGGIIECEVKGVPVGLGQPVFDKLSARLASAMMSINAAKGFEIGMGFDGATKRGSEVVDEWVPVAEDSRGIRTLANHSGGIQGGLSNGENIVFRVAFKPVATLMREIHTVTKNGEPVTIHPEGRHDACVIPRALPVVESMTSMVLLDMLLLDRAYRI